MKNQRSSVLHKVFFCLILLFFGLMSASVTYAEAYTLATTLNTTLNSTENESGQFSYPVGVAVDSLDNVYVTDLVNDRIQKFNSSGAFLTQWGSSGNESGQFRLPWGTAVDSSGNVYVSDLVNDCIQKFNSSGIFLAKLGSSGNETGQFLCPTGVAVDSLDNVYVADTGNSRIQKFNGSGAFLTQWGSSGNESGQFSYPMGVAVDSLDNVYVVDMNNSRIQKFNSSGPFLTQWGSSGNESGQFSYPMGVAVDSLDNVYVADMNNSRIQKFNSSGTFLTQWNSSSNETGQFSCPVGVAINSLGNVYVADMNNLGLFISPAVTEVNWTYSPKNPVVGDKMTITGIAPPNKDIRASVSFEKDIPVVNGKYQYSIEKIKVPMSIDNRFNVTVEGVKNLNVKASKEIFTKNIGVTLHSDASNGVATISQGHVPPTNYKIIIDGDALSTSSSVKCEFTGSKTMKSNSEGKIGCNCDVSWLPPGEYTMTVGDSTIAIDLEDKDDNQKQEDDNQKQEEETQTLEQEKQTLEQEKQKLEYIQEVENDEQNSIQKDTEKMKLLIAENNRLSQNLHTHQVKTARKLEETNRKLEETIRKQKN